MIAVIFEVFPADGRKGDYLERAARLKSELECMDGFISVERFQSLTEPDKLLSLSFWRDEDAVASWRSRAGHRASQYRPQRHFPRLSSARCCRRSRLWHVGATRAGTARQSGHL